jgi:serine/threonine protein kinase
MCARAQGKYGISDVAIKVVFLTGRTAAQRKSVQDSFASEVSILVHMRHPHIISVWGVIDDDVTRLQLVMELATDGDLASLLESGRRLEEHDKIDLCSQMADGEELDCNIDTYVILAKQTRKLIVT